MPVRAVPPILCATLSHQPIRVIYTCTHAQHTHDDIVAANFVKRTSHISILLSHARLTQKKRITKRNDENAVVRESVSSGIIFSRCLFVVFSLSLGWFTFLLTFDNSNNYARRSYTPRYIHSEHRKWMDVVVDARTTCSNVRIVALKRIWHKPSRRCHCTFFTNLSWNEQTNSQ